MVDTCTVILDIGQQARIIYYSHDTITAGVIMPIIIPGLASFIRFIDTLYQKVTFNPNKSVVAIQRCSENTSRTTSLLG